MNVALVYNLLREEMLSGRQLDVIAEYDSQETIDAVTEAIAAHGHRVLPIEANLDVWEELKRQRAAIDLVFNIAEGMDCESRESLVPLMCETLRIPYTGSGPLTQAVCLDKACLKQVLTAHGIRTPAYQTFTEPTQPLRSELGFPCIVKLAAEGSSMGIEPSSVVADEAALRQQLGRVSARYPGKTILVEQFIDGREFTVPVMGNAELEVLPIVEVVFDHVPAGLPKIVFFRPDDEYRSVRELVQATRRDGEMRRCYHRSVCPADVDDALAERLRCLARAAYRAARCRDWCRMEFRMDATGRLFVLEMNPIAGIDPSYYFPKSARAMGLSYAELIGRIIGYAARRYGLGG